MSIVLSPTPWHVEEITDGSGKVVRVEIVDARGDSVVPDVRCSDDAEGIVRAVNAYSELVAAIVDAYLNEVA